jgi:hypothetical protein
MYTNDLTGLEVIEVMKNTPSPCCRAVTVLRAARW